MIKFLIIAGLAFVLYRMIMPKKAIEMPQENPPAEESTDFVEYEEIDD